MANYKQIMANFFTKMSTARDEVMAAPTSPDIDTRQLRCNWCNEFNDARDRYAYFHANVVENKAEIERARDAGAEAVRAADYLRRGMVRYCKRVRGGHQ